MFTDNLPHDWAAVDGSLISVDLKNRIRPMNESFRQGFKNGIDWFTEKKSTQRNDSFTKWTSLLLSWTHIKEPMRSGADIKIFWE